LGQFQGTSTELIEQIEANYNNSKLTNEIGEAIASQTTIEGVLSKVVQLFERRLNYDRGMIMLANAERAASSSAPVLDIPMTN
jgi:transcriptional regulator with GAF, ATPase, and Fis domain